MLFGLVCDSQIGRSQAISPAIHTSGRDPRPSQIRPDLAELTVEDRFDLPDELVAFVNEACMAQMPATSRSPYAASARLASLA